MNVDDCYMKKMKMRK